jgi:hypothetical protein
MAGLKVETDIITSITASLNGTNCDISVNVCRDLQTGRYCVYQY